MNPEARRKLIFLVTEDWYFWSHRLPMARAARDLGFEVAVATRVTAHGERIRAEGFALHPLRWRRGRTNPLAGAAAILEIRRLYRRERPFIVHHVSLKPALLGGIAARLAGVTQVISMVTGMGYMGNSPRWSARLLAAVARRVWPLILLRAGSRVIVQNDEDRDALVAIAPAATPRIVVIPGSGVDLARFRPVPEPPASPVTIAYAGRMIAIKGIATLIEAQQRVRARGVDLRFVLAGDVDVENPTALPRAMLEAWAKLPGVRWLGRIEDVTAIWAQSHIAVLGSLGGEGVPKSLIEAAAMARPIVASDVPGIRIIARDGVNAVLAPPGDVAAFADALATLAADPARRERLGAAGRRLAEEGFSDRSVEEATAAVYRELLAGSGPGNSVSIRPVT